MVSTTSLCLFFSGLIRNKGAIFCLNAAKNNQAKSTRVEEKANSADDGLDEIDIALREVRAVLGSDELKTSAEGGSDRDLAV